MLQSDYQSLHSTETSLVKIEIILSSVPVKAKRLVILLDLSAAFDTVYHGSLIGELFQCGIKDSALALPKSIF